MSDNGSKWKTFYHETSLEAANLIIQQQVIRPSTYAENFNPLFGPGIYFARTINGAQEKSNFHGVCLSADVLITKTKEIDKEDGKKYKNIPKYWDDLRNEGYDSIYGYGMRTGDEVIIFNQDQVKNIKFIKFGKDGGTERPVDTNWNLDNILQQRDGKITLFYATTLEEAKNIENTQTSPKESGQYGEGIYLYNTVEDAVNNHPNSNTFISVYADMNTYFRLNSDEQVTSPNAPSNCEAFYVEDDSIKVFIFINPSLITSIHICGDLGIEHSNIGEVFISNIQMDQNFNIVNFEEEMRRHFLQYGILHSSDAIMIKTKNSKENNFCASALIKFESREKALQSINDLNFTEIGGSIVCLIPIDNEYEKKILQADERKLYVSNVDSNTSIHVLFDEFSKYGKVISIEFPCQPQNKNLLIGYGSIQYTRKKFAKGAMKNQIVINGQQLEICDFHEYQLMTGLNNFTNCFINNLPNDCNPSQIEQLFSQFGTPIRYKVDHDKSRTYGYCMMSTHDEVVKAVNGLNGYNFNGKTISVSRAMSDEERYKAKKKKLSKFEEIMKRELRVVNLDQSVTEQEIINVFAAYGSIEFVKIFKSESNPNTRTAFVCFSSEIEAKSFLTNASSITMHEKNCPVSLASDAHKPKRHHH